MRRYNKIIKQILEGEKELKDLFDTLGFYYNDSSAQLTIWWIWRDDGGDGFESYLSRLMQITSQIDLELLEVGKELGKVF